MAEMIPNKMEIFMNGRNIFPEDVPPNPIINQKMIEYRDKDDTPLYGDSQQQLRSHAKNWRVVFFFILIISRIIFKLDLDLIRKASIRRST